MKHDIASLNTFYVVLGIVVIVVLLTIFGLAHATTRATGTHAPNGGIFVRCGSGDLMLDRVQVRNTLQKIIWRLQRTPWKSADRDRLMANMPLAPQFTMGLRRHELARMRLIKNAIESMQHFARDANIELRRDFCEAKLGQVCGTLGSESGSGSVSGDRVLSRRSEYADDDITAGENPNDNDVSLYVSALVATLEYAMQQIGTGALHAIDLRDVENLIQLDVNPATEVRLGFTSAYPQRFYGDMDPDEFGPTAARIPETGLAHFKP